MAELIAIEAAGFQFSESEMESLMAEIHGDLADLRYIDAALAHIAELESQHAWGPVVNPTAYESVVEVTLGRKYPFVRSVTWRDYSNWAFWNAKDRLEEDLGALAEDAGSWARGEVAAANGHLIHLKHPVELAPFEELDRELASVESGLSTRIDDNFGRMRHLGSWRGTAADNFELEFCGPFPEVRKNQIGLTRSIRAALQASQATAHIGHYSLMNVLTAASGALDEQLRLRSETGAAGAASAKDTLAVVEASTAVMAALTVNVAPVAAALALVSASAQMTSVLLLDTELGVTTTVTVAGASAEELATALTDRLTQIGNYVHNQYFELSDQLREVDRGVQELLSTNRPRLYPRRPYLADGAIDPQTFYHNSAER